jgi:hypothetical protein
MSATQDVLSRVRISAVWRALGSAELQRGRSESRPPSGGGHQAAR